MYDRNKLHQIVHMAGSSTTTMKNSSQDASTGSDLLVLGIDALIYRAKTYRADRVDKSY